MIHVFNVLNKDMILNYLYVFITSSMWWSSNFFHDPIMISESMWC